MFTKLAHKVNYSDIPRSKSSIKYIVVHYTANNGDTARDNLDYYARVKKEISCHFFVDETEVCCSVPWDNTAYHCGTKGKYKHKYCRNTNSIGIELCSRIDSKGKYYFKDETVHNAARFVALQMKNYNIPISNVIRHYDVTGKSCPRPFVESSQAWANFKNLVMKYYNGNTPKKENDIVMQYYEKITEIPAGEMRDTVQKLCDRGIIKGNGAGLHLSYDMCRIIVFLNRAGAFDK